MNCKDGMFIFVSNTRDRNHLNLCLGVFPLLNVVDPAFGDVFKGSIIEQGDCDNTRQDLSWEPATTSAFPSNGL